MYGLGKSLRDISRHIKDMYDTNISHSALSAITDKIFPQVKEWQSRPLEELYTIVWLDTMHYKAKEDYQMVSHAVYNILGINRHGRKELLCSGTNSMLLAGLAVIVYIPFSKKAF